MKCFLALSLALTTSACASERLTGTAAQDAARRYQSAAVAKSPTPLILLDGKEISAAVAKAIEPKTIESIEVVKGAAAVSTYGERGRDGVVTIRSKSPGSR